MKFTMDQIRRELKGPSDEQKATKDQIDKQIGLTIQELATEGILPKNKAIFDAMVKYLAETKLYAREKGLFYFGNCGTGKSFALKVISAFRRIRYFSCEDLQEKFDRSSVGFWETIEERNDIIIDDLGTEETKNDFGIKFELFEKVIYKRHRMFEERGIKTILATNLSADAIKERYDNRIYSRLRQMCECVNAEGKDLRLNNDEGKK